jgi:transposase
MIAAPPGVRVYLACGTTDMRRGMAGLAMQVQQTLEQCPFDGAVFAFRGKRAGLLCQEDAQASCCARDEGGGPFGAAL